MKIHIRQCVECGKTFKVAGRAAGRKQLCGKRACQRARAAKHTAKYMATEKGQRKQREASRRLREEKYDPWQWQNTILEWNE